MFASALLLAAAAAAPEPDGAIAEAARWVEPRGCASGSYRSRALPVVTEIEEAWRLEFEAVEAPPVHWDGTGYVVARAARKPHLVAFDLGTGKELARTALRDFRAASGLLVWDHLVLLQPDEEQITGYRLEGRKLDIRWIFRGQDIGAGLPYRPRLPVVHENEVYCLLGAKLGRMRPGMTSPAWTGFLAKQWDECDADAHAARPAIYGEYAFVAWLGTPFAGALPGREPEDFANLQLSAFRRSDGERVLQETICQARVERGRPNLRLMVAGSKLFVGSDWPLVAADGFATEAMVPLVIERGVRVGTTRLWTTRGPPAHHPRLGAIFLSEPAAGAPPRGGLEWAVEREGKIFLLTSQAQQPECFRDRVTPTVLGDIVYFGSWAADVETGDIVWRLPIAEGVGFPAVPADRLVLVVDGGTLRAFRGRGRR